MPPDAKEHSFIGGDPECTAFHNQIGVWSAQKSSQLDRWDSDSLGCLARWNTCVLTPMTSPSRIGYSAPCGIGCPICLVWNNPRRAGAWGFHTTDETSLGTIAATPTAAAPPTPPNAAGRFTIDHKYGSDIPPAMCHTE